LSDNFRPQYELYDGGKPTSVLIVRPESYGCLTSLKEDPDKRAYVMLGDGGRDLVACE